MLSPTARSLAVLRERGYMAAVVERWNPHVHIRQDLFGFADILAVRPESASNLTGRTGDFLIVQACAGSGHAAHVAKIRAEPRHVIWLSAGGRIQVWSWAKQGARGKRKIWTLRVEDIT